MSIRERFQTMETGPVHRGEGNELTEMNQGGKKIKEKV